MNSLSLSICNRQSLKTVNHRPTCTLALQYQPLDLFTYAQDGSQPHSLTTLHCLERIGLSNTATKVHCRIWKTVWYYILHRHRLAAVSW